MDIITRLTRLMSKKKGNYNGLVTKSDYEIWLQDSAYSLKKNKLHFSSFHLKVLHTLFLAFDLSCHQSSCCCHSSFSYINLTITL